MQRATIKGHRTDAAGVRWIWLLCPYCGGRHWLPAGATGLCPRRNWSPFTIPDR